MRKGDIMEKYKHTKKTKKIIKYGVSKILIFSLTANTSTKYFQYPYDAKMCCKYYFYPSDETAD